jgi:pimeloyl-ACP methyl ester carboxylesterase
MTARSPRWTPCHARSRSHGRKKDSLVPVATYGKTARERLPRATFEVLPDAGHVPMLDDPELVARTILAVTGVEMPQR